MGGINQPNKQWTFSQETCFRISCPLSDALIVSPTWMILNLTNPCATMHKLGTSHKDVCLGIGCQRAMTKSGYLKIWDENGMFCRNLGEIGHTLSPDQIGLESFEPSILDLYQLLCSEATVRLWQINPIVRKKMSAFYAFRNLRNVANQCFKCCKSHQKNVDY